MHAARVSRSQVLQEVKFEPRGRPIFSTHLHPGHLPRPWRRAPPTDLSGLQQRSFLHRNLESTGAVLVLGWSLAHNDKERHVLPTRAPNPHIVPPHESQQPTQGMHEDVHTRHHAPVHVMLSIARAHT